MKVTPQMWSSVSRLLDEALALDVEARVGWLDRLTADHADIAAVVRKLLDAHAAGEAEGALEHLPAFDIPNTGAADSAPGIRIGPYMLKREIASGGMADVWLAERADGAFTREVALKLPHVTGLRRDLAVRFAHERDILARLEHPNIARFYDAGLSPAGLPYIAMEYVQGETITAWCDARCCDLARRVALFGEVLEAVRFAHANLIIHRDLKPSNILVNESGQVRLLDFGIAKLLLPGHAALATELTQMSGRALTPDYASPEQIRGEPLTTATDIYSLGVVLYELLSGRLPYRLELHSVAQLEQAIATIDPDRPSSAVSPASAQARGTSEKRLARALRGDLETIVLKALAKDPAQRYSTVVELAEDLRRLSCGETVHARRASWGYRARKFVLRHRVAVATGVGISVAVVAAAAVSIWQAHRANEQAMRAEEVKNFILSFVQAADVDKGATRETTAVDLLKQARDRLAVAPIRDVRIRAEVLTAVGSGLFKLGEDKLAEPLLSEAVALATKLPADSPIAAQAQAAYGFLLFSHGELKRAEEAFDAAEASARRANDMTALSAALRGKSTLRNEESRYDSAIAFGWEAVRAAESRADVDKSELISAYIRVAGAIASGLRKGALAPARRAYQLAHDYYGNRPMEIALEAQNSYLTALALESGAGSAVREARSVLDQQLRMLGPNHVEVANAYASIGAMQLRAGDAMGSVESFTKAVRIRELLSAGKPTSDLAMGRMNLGSVLANAHRWEEARSAWVGAAAGLAALYGVESEGAHVARSGIGLALTRLGRLEEADAILTPLLAGPFHSPTEEVFIKGRLGQLRSAQGKHREALALLRDTPDAFGYTPNQRLRALALSEYGHALLAAGQVADALTTLLEARKLLLESVPHGSPDLADMALDIAHAQWALGHPKEAVSAAEDAAAFWSQFDPHSRDSGVALLWLARTRVGAGQATDTADTVDRAGSVLATAGFPTDRELLRQVRAEVSAVAKVH